VTDTVDARDAADPTDARSTGETETLLVLVAGTTGTARVPGISAAGSDPTLRRYTPSADAEILVCGEPVAAPAVPVSPTGTPTPAVLTRAVVETLGLDTLVVDAGLREPAAVETHDVGAAPGRDVREPVAVPAARRIYESARDLGRSLDAARVVVGETIPGGTTTAMAVLTALGEPTAVSSSLPQNPTARKRAVVASALTASDTARGDSADTPLEAVRLVGDPVLPAVAGVARGAAEADARVVLGGGTQLAAAAALLRHDGVGVPLKLATTSFVAADETAAVDRLAAALSLKLTVTDPDFAVVGDHPAVAGYRDGEAKEGVCAGGALAVAADRDALAPVRERVVRVYERLVDQ
jgi:uncharacterized protein (TIGR00303 family)